MIRASRDLIGNVLLALGCLIATDETLRDLGDRIREAA